MSGMSIHTQRKGLLTRRVRQLVRQTSTQGLVQLAAGVSAVGSTAVHAAVLGTRTEVAGCGLGQRVADFPCFGTVAGCDLQEAEARQVSKAPM